MSKTMVAVGSGPNLAAKVARVAAAAGTAALYLSRGAPAGANHVNVITASNDQCRGSYHSGEEGFYILDNDVFDSDYCYVNYTWLNGSGTDIGGGGRFNRAQDVSGWSGAYQTAPPRGAAVVRWQVCKERQNDPDICSSWVNHPK